MQGVADDWAQDIIRSQISLLNGIQTFRGRPSPPPSPSTGCHSTECTMHLQSIAG